MEKKTYTEPDVKVYELGPEHASICNTSGSASTASELKFCNEEGEEEQFPDFIT